MARGVHRHRHIRLTSSRRINAETRVANAPRKAKENERRDARMKAAIKANASGDLSPAQRSWVAAKLDKAWRQVTKADIKTLVG